MLQKGVYLTTILVAAVAAFQVGSRLSDQITPVAQEPPVWDTIKRWTGSGIKQTETFQTPSREWRIVWRTTREASPGAGVFQIFVHDGEDRLLDVAANVTGETADTSYVRSPPGPHYLKINSGNVDWSVQVDVQR